MTLRDVERAIVAELRTVAENKNIKLKDVLEWSTGTLTPHGGEVIIYLPELRVSVVIEAALDKRVKWWEAVR